MPRVTDPTKQVTDPVVLAHLSRLGKAADNWEFFQDYAAHGMKEHSPYAKFYRNTDNLSERIAVFSGLPMVDADGVKCEPQWIQAGTTYHQKNNVFSALVNDIPGRVTLTCKNDQPDGVRKKNDRVVFIPQLFVSGVEIPRPPVVLLPVDPRNPNYLENTLEWDYGICKRHLRTIEGRIHGYWIFPSNPGGDVRIVYNQTGEYRLRLGQYATDADTEVIPVSVFAGAVYPFEVSDSATYNPDADPETTSVDGWVGRAVGGAGATWAGIRDGAGTNKDDTAISDSLMYLGTGATAYDWLRRSIFLFDTSGLPDGANITAATLSVRGQTKSNDTAVTPNVNIYTSTPASNTVLANADYGQLGTVAQSDSPIAYADFSVTAYNDFALNATGIGNISKTGVSKFGARNANYDVADTDPAIAVNTTFRMNVSFAEGAAGVKPKLVVTYTGTAPTVTTQIVTAVVTTTATGNGNITNVGSTSVTEHGHCWNTTGSPTTADSKTTNGAGSAGAFTSAMTGFTEGTKYYVRAYATNDESTSYGAQVVFWAGKGTVYDIDPLIRVSRIRWVFDASRGKVPDYYMEISLGGGSYVPAMTDAKPVPALKQSDLPFQAAAALQLDYQSYLRRTDLKTIVRTFGKFPSFTDWMNRELGVR